VHHAKQSESLRFEISDQPTKIGLSQSVNTIRERVGLLEVPPLSVEIPLAIFFFDPRYFLIVGPAILLVLAAQAMVRSAFSRWSQEPAQAGLTGAQVAQRVLALGGVNGVQIEIARGWLSDHYDPRSHTLRLSEANYSGRSVAAAAIAAHEAGHAVQHAQNYWPLSLRSAYVPVAMFGDKLAIPLIFIGAIFSWPPLIGIGVLLFSAVVLFQLLTLPVEFDASRRAKRLLIEGQLISGDHEVRGVSKVLNAAALTYVAATVQALLTLLYYIMILTGRRN